MNNDKEESCHLMDMLAEVIDLRNKKGLRHPLESILGLLVVGFMCGHKGYTSIATWARTQPQLTRHSDLRMRIRLVRRQSIIL